MYWTQQARTATKAAPVAESGQPRSRRLARGALAAGVLLLATTLTTPMVAAQSAANPATPTGAQFPKMVTVDQITDDPSAYDGVTVTLVGDVEDVLGPRAFTIEDQDILFDETLLVVSSRPFAAQPENVIEADMLRSQSVMISGTVHTFNEAAFEDRLGIDLNAERVAAWSGRPALIADRLMAWSYAFATPWQSDAATTVNGRTAATIDRIVASPMSYDQQTVAIGGYVDRVLGDRAFVLGDGDLLNPERVLVMTREQVAGLPGPNVERGLSTQGYVWISGTVHQFNQAAFEQQLGMDLDDTQFSEWAGRPSIIASSIIPIRSAVERHPSMATTPGTPETGAAERGQSSGAATAGDFQGSTGIDAILDAPESYVGQTTTVNGRIEQAIGPIAFVLTDADAESEQLLVVSALSLASTYTGGDGPTPETGESVQVTGEVWSFDVGAIEERTGIDLDDSLFSEWSGRPVVVATAVMPAAQ